MGEISKSDREFIQRCVSEPVWYVYAPDPRGGQHARLIKCNASETLRKHLDKLCLSGHLARSVSGCNGRREPPETHVTYRATAIGREAIDLVSVVKPLVNTVRLKSPSELLAEANAKE